MTKILVMRAAHQINDQPFDNRDVPQGEDLDHWSSYLEKITHKALPTVTFIIRQPQMTLTAKILVLT